MKGGEVDANKQWSQRAPGANHKGANEFGARQPLLVVGKKLIWASVCFWGHPQDSECDLGLSFWLSFQTKQNRDP